MSRAKRRSRPHATYGNVVASLALFLSLGGASYAAFVLPAHSVGPKQLRTGAVTRSALAFPLEVAGVTDHNVDDLAKGPCNSPPSDGGRIQIFCPHQKDSGITTPGREVHLRLRAPGAIMVSVIAGLRDQGAPGTSATVTVGLVLDGHIVDRSESILHGGDAIQMPAQLLTRASAGKHTLGVTVSASYSSLGPGDVLVSPVSVIGSVGPPQT